MGKAKFIIQGEKGLVVVKPKPKKILNAKMLNEFAPDVQLNKNLPMLITMIIDQSIFLLISEKKQMTSVAITKRGCKIKNEKTK